MQEKNGNVNRHGRQRRQEEPMRTITVRTITAIAEEIAAQEVPEETALLRQRMEEIRIPLTALG